MIERLIYAAIKNGIDVITANPAQIEDLFVGQHELTQAEAEKIRAIWENERSLEWAGPPELHHSYPRADSKFPAYFIVLADEGEDEHFLGDAVYDVEDPLSPFRGMPVNGGFWKHTVSVLVMAQHPDVTLYYYQLLKAIIVAQDAYLKESGSIHLVHYSGGDMAPDRNWMPAGIFARRMTLSITSEYNQIVPDEIGRAWKVRGIHMDASGAPGEDVGGVPTLVTAPNPDEDDDEE